MKTFRVRIFKFSQCLLACGVLLLILIALFTANLAVQQASVSLRANVLPCIIIDAGHGGEDGGAQSANGVLEKDINLSIAKKVQLMLQTLGFETKMTRTDDSLIYGAGCTSMREKKVSDIHARYALMEQTPNAFFLSIHQNHFSDPQYHGAQVFYSANLPQSETAAETLQTAITQALQPDNTRMIKPCGTEVYLLYYAKIPAVMVECGFLSNPQEAQQLADENYQTALSVCIVQGLLNYFNHGT